MQKMTYVFLAGMCSLPLTASFAEQQDQSIQDFSFSPPRLSVGGMTKLSATATSWLKPIEFSSKTPAICSTSGENGYLVTGNTVGNCIVSARQAGNAQYKPTPSLSLIIMVAKGTQTIDKITLNPTLLSVESSATLSATASSNLPVSFRATPSSVCSMMGNIITGHAVGTCNVMATQSGNKNYKAAPELKKIIKVVKGNQMIISVSFASTTLSVGGNTTMSATTTSGLPVSFRSDTQSICGVNGNLVIGISKGTCSVVATQAGNTNYQPASLKIASIPVNAIPSQTISAITFTPASLTIDSSATVSASATSGLPVSFSSKTPSICAVLNNTVTSISVGKCQVAANQAGNSSYSAASEVIQDLIISPASQTIGAITFNPATLIEGKTSTVSAAASSGLEVLFSSNTSSICTVSGSTVSGVATGTCMVAANQPGNVNYRPAPQKTQSITVSPERQSFEPEMISIPSGTFQMGSPTTEEYHSYYGDETLHSVTVAAFEMSKYEVTFDEYDSFTDATGKSKLDDSGWGRGKRPVINVSWNEATDYAKWLSTQTGKNYRLPTEAEWEYAARAGTTTAYWWGNSIGSNQANCDNSYCGDSWGYTAPVDSFSANPWGLHDTAGNVWEWTCSAWSNPYDGSEKVCQTNSDVSRVIRGGSWGDDPAGVRAAIRSYGSPGYRGYGVGFRLARTPF